MRDSHFSKEESMKSKLLNFRVSLFIVAAGLLVFAGAASPQSTERVAGGTIQVGTVTGRSPAVSLKAVGKEVAPGMFEVDPGSISGKRLTVPHDQAQRKICIGRWKDGECRGIYIEW